MWQHVVKLPPLMELNNVPLCAQTTRGPFILRMHSIYFLFHALTFYGTPAGAPGTQFGDRGFMKPLEYLD